MKKIVLISCSSKKLSEKSKAKEIYSSDLFKKNLEYAISLNPDVVYILSAKYGLLNLEEEIEPYNVTLNKMPKNAREDWARDVIKKLKEIVDLERDKIIFLAGQKYREFLISEIKNYEIPLKGLGIGKQLKFLKEKLEKKDDCFIVFKINDKEERLKTESKIISTISLCENCKPSKNWLGNFSPKEKIRESGLWLVNELYKEPLSEEDILKMKKLEEE